MSVQFKSKKSNITEDSQPEEAKQNVGGDGGEEENEIRKVWQAEKANEYT